MGVELKEGERIEYDQNTVYTWKSFSKNKKKVKIGGREN